MLSKINCSAVLLSAMAALYVPCGRVPAQEPLIIQHQTTTPPPAQSSATAIDRVKAGDYSVLPLEAIAKEHVTGAIPALEEQFLKTNDPVMKGHFASVLVRLGDGNEVYWDYIVNFATKGVESDIPDINHYDQNGKPFTDPSPAFLAWAANHGLTVAQAQQESIQDLFAVKTLAITGDPRGVPLLREGLLSPNPLIEVDAARGLANVKDTESVPLIIAACERSPRADLRAAIAKQLVYFDDPDSQRAVAKYVPEKTADAERAYRASGGSPW
jgi:hypothetical protein